MTRGIMQAAAGASTQPHLHPRAVPRRGGKNG